MSAGVEISIWIIDLRWMDKKSNWLLIKSTFANRVRILSSINI